ncbi:unnamed protein product, partial [Allacma fusca]
MDFTSKKSVPNPTENSKNILSTIFFWWAFPVLRKGSKQTLNINDIFDCLKSDDAGILGKSLSDAWDNVCMNAKLSGTRPRFYKALLKVFLLNYITIGLLILVNECVVRMVQFVYLYKLITAFNDGSSVEDRYIYGTVIVVTTFIYMAGIHWPRFAINHVGMRCRISACSLIYRKALRLSKAAEDQATVGQLVNLMSNDVCRFDTNLNFVHFMVIGPLQLGVMLYFLWTWADFGVTSLAGVGFLIFLIPFQYYISVLFAENRFKTAKRTDKRGQMMNEIIIAMRVIKMYAWEKPFSVMVDQLRRSEVKILRRTSYLKSFYMSMYISSSKVIIYLTLLAFLLTSGKMNASSVFLLVQAANVMRQIMVYFIPHGAAHLSELVVSANRIEEYLLLEEMSRDVQAISENNNNQLEEQEPGEDKKRPEASVALINTYASWTKEAVTLEDVTLNLRGEKLVMVIGPVGSGKTSFLHALISELPISKGKCVVTGRTSYAAQEPWIFAGNIRQNILFGREFNSSRYSSVVEASALEEDFKQLAYGENTIVGERGIALSGGQKARVNLARALYQKADIYLLDDPLSAVDARVSRHIFEKCVQGHMKNKLRILVTHQLQYLPRADHVIILQRGKVAAQGTYAELIQEGIDFLSLMTDDTEEAKRGRKREDSVSSDKVQEVLSDENEDLPERKDETMAGGTVNGRIYKDYFGAGGSILAVVCLILGFLIYQGLYSFSDYWLSFWVRKAENDTCNESTTMDLFLETSSEGPCEAFEYESYFYIYTGIVIALFFITKATAMYWSYYCMKISVNVHDNMFKSLVRAPTKFFDDNPSGRILNRFTKDMGSMDELLPPTFFDAVSFLLFMAGSVVAVIAANYYLAIPAFFLTIMLYLLRRFYMKTAADLKRIEAMARSPIYTHLSATLQGLTTIRASKSEEILIKQFDGYQNIHSSVFYVFMGGDRWFGIWLEMISMLFIVFVVYGFMILSEIVDFHGGQVGLAISSCLGIAGGFQWGMRQSAETENLMTSVERALEYSKLKPEAPLESTQDKKPPKDWPKSGSVRFQNVYLAYEDTDVLKNLSFEMKDKEKIGIVGRTGAGKSTIIAALFRMTEPRGDVFIDNIRINDIGLHDLRKNVSIIPQDPVLFSGTIRYNLDPFDQFKDDELWQVIEEVELKEAVPALDFKVSDGDCSIITIAHRLHSVMDCDKILVLDNGVLIEYDHPYILLQNPNGILTSMVSHTGTGSTLMLGQVAEDSWKRNQKGLEIVSVNNIANFPNNVKDPVNDKLIEKSPLDSSNVVKSPTNGVVPANNKISINELTSSGVEPKKPTGSVVVPKKSDGSVVAPKKSDGSVVAPKKSDGSVVAPKKS